LAVISANIWNDSANISPFYNNNTFWILNGATLLNIPFLQEGLYSLDNVGQVLSIALVNLGYDKDTIELSADVATGLVIITFKTIGFSWDFTQPNSLGSILGFSTNIICTSVNQSFYGDSVATFNRVDSFLITSDIVSQGIPINNFGQGIIANIGINSAPSTIAIYDPQNPIYCDAMELVGMQKQNFSFQLRDQSLRTVSTNEIYTFTVCIKYSVIKS
jgi:hypothetical protein